MDANGREWKGLLSSRRIHHVSGGGVSLSRIDANGHECGRHRLEERATKVRTPEPPFHSRQFASIRGNTSERGNPSCSKRQPGMETHSATPGKKEVNQLFLP